MDNIKEYQERVNKGVFTLVEAKLFIDDFNCDVLNYGRCTVAEVLGWVEPNTYTRTVKFVDYKYGWTNMISLEKNFKVNIKENDISFTLKLPKPICFD